MLGLSLLLLLPGCTNKFVINDDNPALARSMELVGVPFFPQEKLQCGPAALATVLQYYGHAVTPAFLEPYLFIPEKKGSLAIEMQATSRRYGMLAVAVEPTIEALLLELSHGYPVLVLQNLGFDWFPQWHFAVAVGYDLERGVLMLRSGTYERLLTPMHVFMKTWRRADHWALVIRPAGELPASDNIHNVLSATAALEQLGRHQAAYDGFAAIVQRWPESLIAWMGLGNNAYALRNFTQAQSSFHEAIKKDKHYYPGWNNLAYTFVALGCPQQAVNAMQCAAWLSSVVGDDDLLREINQQGSVTNNACVEVDCPLSEPLLQ